MKKPLTILVCDKLSRKKSLESKEQIFMLPDGRNVKFGGNTSATLLGGVRGDMLLRTLCFYLLLIYSKQNINS